MSADAVGLGAVTVLGVLEQVCRRFLSKYQDTFRRAGLLLARDFTHLDNDALVSLGITATGHRKRILRLVSHIQRAESQRANQKPDLPRDRCQSVTEVILSERGHSAAPRRQSSGPVNFEALRNSSAPNLGAMLASSDGGRPAVKPVPKPRTVFNRRRTAPIQFCPTPDPAPPSTRRLSQESICFTVLEGFTSGDTPTPDSRLTSDLNDKSATPNRRASQAERRKPSRSLSLSDAGGLLPPVPPRLNRGIPPATFQGSPPSSSPVRTQQNQTPPGTSCFGSLDNSRLSGSSPTGSPRGGGMEMVSNEIYWGTLPGSTAPGGGRSHCSQQSAPPTPPRQTPDRNPERNSGSTLSNNSSGSARASTDDPEEEISPYCETVFQTRRNPHICEMGRSRLEEKETRKGEDKHAEDHGFGKLSWTKRLSQALHSGDSQGYSTVGEPPPPGRYLSLPNHTFPSEGDEDLTISPYASYTSLTERAPPIISGWLDKLSPQGNYVFQKRYVKFDGKNLMYFGSEKDVYPKGVIPLAAIQMARPAKDNKFEIVTSHRIFVFRADNEVLRRRWVGTLQEHVRDQLVFGRRRFGPGSHCQKHGVLELKGTKSKVYAAINTEQIWIYKSEQRPLHPKEKVLEQALQWCKMADPSSAYLVVKRVPKGDGINILTSYKSEIMKIGLLRCREEPPKLLQGNKFQERTFQIINHKLLLLKDKKSIKPEKEWSLKSMKIYIGIRRKLKAPSRWGFTVMSDKHQLYLCCSSEAELWDWITSFLKAQNDDPGPPVLRRHSSSDISKQKFGTMPLVPIRGDESNSSMLSANQTLRKLHDRRTLSMYFPMKVQQDSFEERSESPDLPEPLYEEVGDFGLQVLKSLETSFLSSSAAETQEVPDHPPLRLVPVEARHVEHIIVPDPVSSSDGSVDTLDQSGGSSSGGGDGEDLNAPQPPAVRRRQQLQGVCTPSQELLLQELSSAFTKKNEEEEEQQEQEEEERPYDV
ncbi:arf-GAP with Rho-GAP domain, ANK repeat and PH domain-containing protein 3-like [Plectropomus leopardus]|uniref:arf-GAP with Rho-GAP domain, ANK repeat and PH domain-containing protein 3-like n=1 Tax=Plectropomus leopardus TaxID=160734 RepID=UPI001C4A9709|nr:arf-GAP with Rho-GAP domain, ANK repeat and PH domain-containing protein 3-like [Plectropomus leopardus]